MKRANVLKNSFWYGIEMAADLVFGLLTSIAIARVMGPERLGHYVFLVFVTNVAGKLAGFGTGQAARKYIAEYLAAEQPGLARAVFFTALRLQVLLAIVVPALLIAATFVFGDPAYRLVAFLLMLAMTPSFIGAIPALANVAAQNFSRNVKGALVGLVCYTAGVVLTLTLGWGLPGLAASVLLRRTVETSLRLVPAIRWMRTLPAVSAPAMLKRKLLTFSGQALGVTVLTLVIWDRSELIFLKQFADVKQLAFYSVAFSLTEYILMIPRTMGGAVGAALMSAYGRGTGEAATLGAASIRRLLLAIVPVHIGVAALSGAAVRLVYGAEYLGAIPVLAIAAILSLPKGLYWLPQQLLQAADRQVLLLRWLSVTAVLNLALDAALIPAFGAVGAAIGNGVAQSFAVIVLIGCAGRVSGMITPWGSIVRVSLCGLAMAPPMAAITWWLPPAAALPAGIVAGALIYIAGLRVTRAVAPEDAEALQQLASKLPAPARAAFLRLTAAVARTPAASPAAVGSWHATAS